MLCVRAARCYTARPLCPEYSSAIPSLPKALKFSSAPLSHLIGGASMRFEVARDRQYSVGQAFTKTGGAPVDDAPPVATCSLR